MLEAENRTVLVGIDEVGRGCLAGPVWACAYAFHPGIESVKGVKDSKKLSPKKRESLKDPLKAAGWHGHGVVEPQGEEGIDAMGIGPATFLAMHRALVNFQAASGLPWSALDVVIDGNVLPKSAEWVALGLGRISCIVKADDLVPAVSAASVLAKVERDALMADMAFRHPGYGFEGNAGYGSSDHMAALAVQGPTPQHRMSFAPMKHMADRVDSPLGVAKKDAQPASRSMFRIRP